MVSQLLCPSHQPLCLAILTFILIQRTAGDDNLPARFLQTDDEPTLAPSTWKYKLFGECDYVYFFNVNLVISFPGIETCGPLEQTNIAEAFEDAFEWEFMDMEADEEAFNSTTICPRPIQSDRNLRSSAQFEAAEQSMSLQLETSRNLRQLPHGRFIYYGNGWCSFCWIDNYDHRDRMLSEHRSDCQVGESVLLDENFENYEETWNLRCRKGPKDRWQRCHSAKKIATEGTGQLTSFLGPFKHKEAFEMGRYIGESEIKDQDLVEISFDFYEIDHWRSNQNGLNIRIYDHLIYSGPYKSGRKGKGETQVGFVDELSLDWNSTSISEKLELGYEARENGHKDQKHRLSFTFPVSAIKRKRTVSGGWIPYLSLQVETLLPKQKRGWDKTTGRSGFDNFKIKLIRTCEHTTSWLGFKALAERRLKYKFLYLLLDRYDRKRGHCLRYKIPEIDIELTQSDGYDPEPECSD